MKIRTFCTILFFTVPFFVVGQQDMAKYYPNCDCSQIVEHFAFSICYDEQSEQAKWVLYELTSSEVNGSYKRTNDFRVDPNIRTGSASLSDYKGSGYDRGHLAPAGDMKWSYQAMSESFYMSNMSPQNASFNRGIWRVLESQVRNWANARGEIIVITGAVLSNPLHFIGINKVAVPSYYYKVILDTKRQEVLALILPNQKGKHQLIQYTVPVDYLEGVTNIDFFPFLDDNLENKIESVTVLDNWDFNKSSNSSQSKGTALQCKGIAKSTGVRCGNKTNNVNQLCHHHQSQSGNSNYQSAPAKRTISIQCSGTTQKGFRCKRKTLNMSGRCYQHD